jgi:DNA-binding transcriptional regulator LsrR (DeoR family)
MIRIPKVTMSMRELDRLKCIQGLIDGQLKQTAVAARLGLTTRQVRRLVRRYEQQGPIRLISRLRDRPSNRRLKSDTAEHAFGILRSTYARASNGAQVEVGVGRLCMENEPREWN